MTAAIKTEKREEDANGIISIADLEAGKLDPDSVVKEVKALREMITELRYEMCLLLKQLSSVDENTTPAVMYQDVVKQVKKLEACRNSYYQSYRRLLPVIIYAKTRCAGKSGDGIKIKRHDVPVNRALLREPKGKGANTTGNRRGSTRRRGAKK